ncbi:MAG TPA: TonB family protein [Opitutaceae bacterium]|nr:TonB family protein [Opitutaceae bacterium]
MLSLGTWIAVSAATAKSYEESYVESFSTRTDMPVPVKAITPDVPSVESSVEVEVKFVVDTAGVPRDISVADTGDAPLEASLAKAVSQWRFRPLLKDGKAVTSKVILPVRIIRYEDDALVAMR